jgi:hypothetical protein
VGSGSSGRITFLGVAANVCDVDEDVLVAALLSVDDKLSLYVLAVSLSYFAFNLCAISFLSTWSWSVFTTLQESCFDQ